MRHRVGDNPRSRAEFRGKLSANTRWMHLGNGREITGKGDLVKEAAIRRVMYDSAVVCTLMGSMPVPILGVDSIATLLSSVSGHPYTVEELDHAGMRVIHTERLVQNRLGVRRRHDRLPDRLLQEPTSDGPNQGLVVPLEELKDDLYRSLGWDISTGVPAHDTLAAFGLEKWGLEGYVGNSSGLRAYDSR